ncbi:pyridoxamine 5'-phosphate oxidase family protein [Gordonia hankookensis]|uniref:Pyridoxamine 5'-phosphate oxidase family protein n=2 Tax=Gordonia hankookensis TaxID=589403 RepID=A0ABR7W5V7_9ACTN|nr:pyridoxamine 5'-phosphate oxidase family protein [Gordonia hankookensis]MBD1318220.1 pyridoxamine 5'-phosphate oxidase family protein [Gordonia hankookensis]
MALTRSERELFLAEPHIAALAAEAGPDRAPLVVPIWYQYAPGGSVWFLTGTSSRKLALIREAGRCSLMVETLEPTIRYVSVSGDIESYTDGTREQLTEMAARYLPAEKVAGYVDFAWENHGAQTKVVLRAQRWVSSDLGRL